MRARRPVPCAISTSSSPACPSTRRLPRRTSSASARDRQECAVHRGRDHGIDPDAGRRQSHRAQIDDAACARQRRPHATGAQGRPSRRRLHLRSDGRPQRRAQRAHAHRDSASRACRRRRSRRCRPSRRPAVPPAARGAGRRRVHRSRSSPGRVVVRRDRSVEGGKEDDVHVEVVRIGRGEAMPSAAAASRCRRSRCRSCRAARARRSRSAPASSTASRPTAR